MALHGWERQKNNRVGRKVFIILNKITQGKIIFALSTSKNKTKNLTTSVRQHQIIGQHFYVKLRKCRAMCIRLIITVYFLSLDISRAGSKEIVHCRLQFIPKQKYV